MFFDWLIDKIERILIKIIKRKKIKWAPVRRNQHVSSRVKPKEI